MSKAIETRNVVAYCYNNDMLLETLPHMLEQLEVCQKALSGFLDQKRASFPRFYFISDANLLEILAQSTCPVAIQPHLQSVFAAVVRMGFDPSSKLRICELFDSFDECIKLDKPIEMQVARCRTLVARKTVFPQIVRRMLEMFDDSSACLKTSLRSHLQGNIEEWLSKLLASMQRSVNGIVHDACADCEEMPIEEFTFKYPAQIALLGIQVRDSTTSMKTWLTVYFL